MLNLSPQKNDKLRILCVGAHSDDIEIGAGATLLSLADRYPGAEIRWVVFAAAGERRDEAVNSGRFFTEGFAAAQIDAFDFRDGYLPTEFPRLKHHFETLKGFEPDLVFTHNGADRHQDHRTVSELAWQTFRNHWILEYEIPKYDGDLGAPNVFHVVSSADCDRKVDALDRVFGSQRSKRWFSRDTFTGLMRLRGVECQSETGFAEAFYCRKMVIE